MRKAQTRSVARKRVKRLVRAPLWVVKLAVGVALLSAAWTHAAAQATLSLTNETCPVCQPLQTGARISAQLFTLGVTGRDVLGHTIGLTPAGSKWQPILPSKRTICGALRKVDHHNDDDFSFNIEPYAYTPSAALLDAAKENATSVSCANDNCVHAEINLDGAFPTANELFQLGVADLDSDSFGGDGLPIAFKQGHTVCVYGPWVYDDNHGNRPEIHPAELIWWKQSQPINRRTQPTLESISETYIWMLQDDSNRFDVDDHFNFPCGELPHPSPVPIICYPKADWSRPWAKVPRRSEIRMRFGVNVNDSQLLSYLIDELRARKIITGDDAAASKDQGTGGVYQIDFNGMTVVRVEERQPDDHLGVVFESLCRNEAGTVLYGEVVMNSKYGTGSSGDEGYHSLRITEVRSRTLPVLAGRRSLDPRERLMLLNKWADSLHLTIARPPGSHHSAVRRRLTFVGPLRRVESAVVADIAVDSERSAGTTPKVTSARFEVAGRAKPLLLTGLDTPQDSVGEGRAVRLVTGVPLLSGGAVVLTLEQGRSYRLPIPKLAIVPKLLVETPDDPRPSPEAWVPFAAASHSPRSPAGLSAPPGTLTHVSGWTIEMLPRYATLESDGVAEEDETPMTRMLNAALDSATRAGSAPRLASLFAPPHPFSVRWRFRATNVTTGGRVAVVVGGRAPAGAIEVDTAPGSSATLRLRVRFPQSASAIYRLDVVGILTEIHGLRGEIKRSFWSHYLTRGADTGGTDLAKVASQLAGADPIELAEASRFDLEESSSAERDSVRWRVYAQTFRASASHALRDGRVTLDELQRLRRMAAVTASLNPRAGRGRSRKAGLRK